MAFMLLFVEQKGAPAGAPAGGVALARFQDELARAGKLLRAGTLAPESDAVRVVACNERTHVTGGPFGESREAVGGFWILDVASREEAVEIARRACELGAPREGAAVDVHVLAQRYSVRPDPGSGTAFLLAFHNDPFLTDADGSKMERMIAFGAALERDGKLFETTPLAREGPPPRVEQRGGRILVTEGPFAEAKEVIGGFSLLRAASRAEAIDVATRYPAARWGTVEVREIVALT
jgi:hypothetical protein